MSNHDRDPRIKDNWIPIMECLDRLEIGDALVIAALNQEAESDDDLFKNLNIVDIDYDNRIIFAQDKQDTVVRIPLQIVSSNSTVIMAKDIEKASFVQTFQIWAVEN
jgi:hypothetical protein